MKERIPYFSELSRFLATSFLTTSALSTPLLIWRGLASIIAVGVLTSLAKAGEIPFAPPALVHTFESEDNTWAWISRFDTASHTSWRAEDVLYSHVVYGGFRYEILRNSPDQDPPFGDVLVPSHPDYAGYGLSRRHSYVRTDIDGDGDLDQVYQKHSGPFDDMIVWRDYTGGVTQVIADYSAWGLSSDLEVGDINCDGAVDVCGVVKISTGETSYVYARWWENANGDGTEWRAHGIPVPEDWDTTYRGRIRLGDLDGDGDLDLVSAAAAGPVFWWENQNGSGAAWAVRDLPNRDFPTPASGAVYKPDVTDLDEDGDLDILAIERNGGSPVWWENQGGTPPVWERHKLPLHYLRYIRAGDFDKDGDMDLVWPSDDDDIHDTTYVIEWQKNETIHRSAVFPIPLTIAEGWEAGTHALASADFDGDGDTDVLSSSPTDTSVVLYRNFDDTAFGWMENDVDLSLSAKVATACDLDGDGDIDIVATTPAISPSSLTWWENDGSRPPTWTRHTIASNFHGAGAVAAGDLDNDGDLDILAASQSDDLVRWWKNDGTPLDGGWETENVSTTRAGPVAIRIADLDWDQRMDIVVAFSGEGKIVCWANTKVGDEVVFEPEDVNVTAFDGVNSIDVSDMDRDGDLDILGSSAASNSITWWENDSDWRSHRITTSAEGVTSVRAVDLDKDGDSDVVAALGSERQLVWWENADRMGTSWFMHIDVPGLDTARDVLVADLNRDGTPDLVASGFAGAPSEPALTWWPNLGGQFSLTAGTAAPERIEDARTVPLLVIFCRHQGREGDHAAEVTSLHLRWEQESGAPLTQDQFDALFTQLDIYRDDGNDGFDVTDTLVTNVANVVLDGAGGIVLSFVDSAEDLSVDLFLGPATRDIAQGGRGILRAGRKRRVPAPRGPCSVRETVHRRSASRSRPRPRPCTRPGTLPRAGSRRRRMAAPRETPPVPSSASFA